MVKTSWMAGLLVTTLLAFGCGPDPSASFRSVNNSPGTFDWDFTGDGGDVSQAFS